MTIMAPAIRGLVPALSNTRRLEKAVRWERVTETARLVAGIAAGAVATGILVFATPLTAPLAWSAALSHGTAVMLIHGLFRGRPSRRWIGCAATLAIPLVGTVIAAAAMAARGRGSAAALRPRATVRRRPTLTVAALRRLASALSPCDALDCGDAEERRRALSALSQREDPEAIALLRRAAAGCDPDLAMFAAMVLDEIGQRAERHVCLASAEGRHAAG